MGRPRKPGLEWLDPENADQHHWARDYLRQRGHESLVDANINPLSISRRDLLRVGQTLEEGKGARELFRDMKDAWRQLKNRSKKKEEGYRPCLFTLKGTTRDDLQRMANEQGTDATALLEKLIEKAYKNHLKKQQRAQQPKQPKQTIYGDRQDINQLRDSPDEAKAPTEEHEEPAEHSPEKRTLTMRLGEEPTAKADDQPERCSHAPEDEIQEPLRGSAEEPHPSSEIHAQEQRADIDTANPAESPEIWIGTAPTEEDMRYALEKNAETAKHIRDERTKLKP